MTTAHGGTRTLGFPGLLVPSEQSWDGAKSEDLMRGGASVSVHLVVCDVECDVGVKCWCYGSQRSGGDISRAHTISKRADHNRSSHLSH